MLLKERRKLGKYLNRWVTGNYKLSPQRQTELLGELIDFYRDIDDEASVEARQLRQTFLFAVAAGPYPPRQKDFIDFFIDHITPDDFQEIQWGNPERFFHLTEFLYALRDHLPAEEVAHYINNLTLHALSSFEKQRQYHKMVELLQLVSLPYGVKDKELLQLRSHAYVHEIRRVRRFRRLLYAYLILQAALVLFVFPLLFINAENGAISEAFEEATDVQLKEERRQYLTYADGLYWSMITAASIGYGDITPVTEVGRIIAATLGMMGVITIGILAGLILYQITPRNF